MIILMNPGSLRKMKKMKQTIGGHGHFQIRKIAMKPEFPSWP